MSSRVLVLHSYLADYYRRRYGIECTVLRQIVRHAPLPAKRPPSKLSQSGAGQAAAERGQAADGRPLLIGFSGAIYGNNRRQLADLAAIVGSDPGMRLRIWTDATCSELRDWQIHGPRVDVAYEGCYERLLEHLAACDVLYLPLSFVDDPNISANSLQYAFPTKSLDYLVSGTPILVHCPERFELSRFFSSRSCGYVSHDASRESLHRWLRAYQAGEIAPLDDHNRQAALSLFSPDENKRLLNRVISEEIERAGLHHRGVHSPRPKIDQ